MKKHSIKTLLALTGVGLVLFGSDVRAQELLNMAQTAGVELGKINSWMVALPSMTAGLIGLAIARRMERSKTD